MARQNMATGARRRPRTASELHRDWLGLLRTEGPFLSVPVLRQAWPQGIDPLGQTADESKALAELKRLRPPLEAAWDAWHAASLADDAGALREALEGYRPARDAWADSVLRSACGWGAGLRRAPDVGIETDLPAAASPDGAVRTEPTAALFLGGGVRALVLVVDPQEAPLDDNYPPDGWSASTIDRMAAMLRAGAGASVGVVTDGRWWAVVSAPRGGATAWGMTDSLAWSEDVQVRNAFARMLDPRLLWRGVGGTTLQKMFKDSVAKAEEVTESLGQQVRAAVELLVAAFAEDSSKAVEAGLEDPLPADPGQVYEAAVAVMMRVVFLLFAQERDLLPSSALFTGGYGLLGVLDALEARARAEGEESMDGTSHAWHRLLATSNAVFRGATFEDMRLPAYGGSVFDPGRHPFLTAVDDRGALRAAVSDRVMLHVLKSVQEISTRNDPEPRRLSFREIDVEQIGYIYEGLLGFTCERASEIVLGLRGKGSDEPEIPLSVLEGIAEKAGGDPASISAGIVDYLDKETPLAKGSIPTKGAYEKQLRTYAQEDELRLVQATGDLALRERLRRWIAIVRTDLRGKPVVFKPGDLYVSATSSRRDAGAHYTPRALAEDVVLHALQPLVYSPGPNQTDDRSLWRRRPSDEILDLKVADIACGSGAFLVAAARYLAGELCGAWEEEGQLLDLAPDRRRTYALRKVVANCLYGVDINEMAVEMCKLSLWLVSLDPGRPFSFVDNRVLVGNSLLGVTDLDQVRNLSVDGKRRTVAGTKTERLFYTTGRELDGAYLLLQEIDLDSTIRQARDIRAKLSEDISENDPMRAASAKARLMEQYDRKIADLRRAADGLIAAGLSAGGKQKKKLEAALDRLSEAVAREHPGDGSTGTTEALDDLLEEGLTPTVLTDYARWKCLHWPLEVPEVMERGGFDAIVGNPPFLGGQKLTGSMGTNVRDWLVSTIADSRSGSADLCAYFFLRAYELLRPNGMIGLLATNTIAQGATRKVGLEYMVANGFQITRAIRSEKWPVSSASIEYASVWGVKGELPDSVTRICDGARVGIITSVLEPKGRVSGEPCILKANQGIAFQGINIRGMGFTINAETAAEWVQANENNKKVLFPYLNGNDLNSHPDFSASRWVIDFSFCSEEEAQLFTIPFQHIAENVKEERVANKDPNVSNYPWWRFWRPCFELRKAISSLDEVLTMTLVSNSLIPVRVHTGVVFSHKLVVFASNSFALQAVLSSSPHISWAMKYGSTLGAGINYSPSDVFVTFPFPEELYILEPIGRELDSVRREIMLRRQLGLTDLYNMVNDADLSDSADADVARMRSIHRELDEAVMDACGWGDVPLNHGFHEYRKMVRWTVCPEARDEILDRLLEENHRRAALEESENR